MLGATDGELVRGVEVHQFGDGVERRAVVSQHVLAVFALRELDVHETLAAPGTKTTSSSYDKRGEEVTAKGGGWGIMQPLWI